MSLALLCGGQGGQTAEALLALVNEPAAAPVIDAFFAATALDASRLAALTVAALHANHLAQPLICATQLATAAALFARGLEVKLFAGYSVGELAAHGCAGALDATALMTLAVRRAAAMDAAAQAVPGGLVAVRGPTRAAAAALAERTGTEIAIVNGADRFVFGGPTNALQTLATAADAGTHLTPLPVTVASHTRLMEGARAPFAAALETHLTTDPRSPVLAGVDGTPVYNARRARDVLARQLVQTVEWRACLHSLPEMGCRAALDLGPGAALARMARDEELPIDVRAVADFRTLDGVATWARRHGD